MASLQQEIQLLLNALARAEHEIVRTYAPALRNGNREWRGRAEDYRRSISNARLQIAENLLSSDIVLRGDNLALARQVRSERQKFVFLVGSLKRRRSLRAAAQLAELSKSYVAAAISIGGGSQRFP